MVEELSPNIYPSKKLNELKLAPDSRKSSEMEDVLYPVTAKLPQKGCTYIYGCTYTSIEVDVISERLLNKDVDEKRRNKKVEYKEYYARASADWNPKVTNLLTEIKPPPYVAVRHI